MESRRAALDAQLLDWMREWDARELPETGQVPAATPDPSESDARFDLLAQTLFAFQFEHCEPYARFCRGRGISPDAIGHWSEIPAVPAGAFKEVVLRCFPAERSLKTFRTSGTSSGRRGELHLDTLALYEHSLRATIRRYLFPDLGRADRMNIQVLAPTPAEAPDSSLSHMFGCSLDELGSSRSGYRVVDGALQLDPLLAEIARACAGGEAIALCGTAFAFVHLLDALDQRGHRHRLPPRSRIMETGGFKGRSREVPRAELYHGLEDKLGVERSSIVNQYGMTELASQFYDSVIWDTAGPRRKLGPPWARVRILDPETGEEAAPGEVGVVAIWDLANTGSVAAVETSDLGRLVGDDRGFEVIGREVGAEARGCSIAADAMLEDTR